MAKRAIYEGYKNIYNKFSGPKTESSFQQTGTLTPKEFVEAGDSLCQKCPVWEWVSGNNELQSFLPPNKKFLVFKGAVSYERAGGGSPEDQEAALGQDDNEGWVSTYPDHVVKAAEEEEEENDDDENNNNNDDENENEEAKPAENDDNEDGDGDGNNDDGDDDSGTRLYDVYVLYDKYYQTPRVYLMGYENGKPLSKEEMMEDVFSINREKTVSVDQHPYIDAPCISIHPCRHAETMKTILGRQKDRHDAAQEQRAEDDREPFLFPTYMALFTFLKFISSVVPTIQYDLATDVEM